MSVRYDEDKLKEINYLRKRLKELMREVLAEHPKPSVYATLSRMRKKGHDAT